MQLPPQDATGGFLPEQVLLVNIEVGIQYFYN
jgi:hypothetical protein